MMKKLSPRNQYCPPVGPADNQQDRASYKRKNFRNPDERLRPGHGISIYIKASKQDYWAIVPIVRPSVIQPSANAAKSAILTTQSGSKPSSSLVRPVSALATSRPEA